MMHSIHMIFFGMRNPFHHNEGRGSPYWESRKLFGNSTQDKPKNLRKSALKQIPVLLDHCHESCGLGCCFSKIYIPRNQELADHHNFN